MISGNVANKPVKGFPASKFLNYAFNNRLRLYSHPDELWQCPGNPGFKLVDLKSDELVQISDPDRGWQFEKWDDGTYQLIHVSDEYIVIYHPDELALDIQDPRCAKIPLVKTQTGGVRYSVGDSTSYKKLLAGVYAKSNKSKKPSKAATKSKGAVAPAVPTTSSDASAIDLTDDDLDATADRKPTKKQKKKLVVVVDEEPQEDFTDELNEVISNPSSDINSAAYQDAAADVGDDIPEANAESSQATAGSLQPQLSHIPGLQARFQIELEQTEDVLTEQQADAAMYRRMLKREPNPARQLHNQGALDKALEDIAATDERRVGLQRSLDILRQWSDHYAAGGT